MRAAYDMGLPIVRLVCEKRISAKRVHTRNLRYNRQQATDEGTVAANSSRVMRKALASDRG